MKKMKQPAAFILILCLCVGMLASCSFFGVSVSAAPSPSASQPVTPTPQEEGPPTVSPELTVDPDEEPPLEDYIKALAVPDFLDEEQQTLYRRAYALFFIFRGDTSGVESFPLSDGSRVSHTSSDSYKKVEINGYEYYFSEGRYKNWDDFEAVILSVFTKEYFDELNGEGGPRVFEEKDGALCYLDAAMGSDPRYFGEDTFELVSKSDAEIKFNVIGTFHEYIPSGDTALEKDVKEDGDFTASFPLTLVKTADGWRFSEFSKTH